MATGNALGCVGEAGDLDDAWDERRSRGRSSGFGGMNQMGLVKINGMQGRDAIRWKRVGWKDERVSHN